MLKNIRKFLFGLSLEGILSSFEEVAKDLEVHMNNKINDSVFLSAVKVEIENEIRETEAEVARAKRVLDKVTKLVA